jgi:sugar-specific transcriptional regulator TrmB
MTNKSSYDLNQFGFDEKTEAIYLALLELGETTVSALVKKSGIKRTTVYAALEGLLAKGLLSLSKRKKRTLYIAEDPRLLLKQFVERKQ